jgi:hypothetical protein
MSQQISNGARMPIFLGELGAIEPQHGVRKTLFDTYSQVSGFVLSQMSNYDGSEPNARKALKATKGNCVAYAALFSALASTIPEISSGMVVVGSEFSNAAHCMSSLIDFRTGEYCIADNKVIRVRTTDGTNVHDSLSVKYAYVTPSLFDESCFGGMSTALGMLKQRVDRGQAELPTYEFHDATLAEKDEWSIKVGGEDRYSNVFVHGFFGDSVADVTDYLTDGISSDTSDIFHDAMLNFTENRLQ